MMDEIKWKVKLFCVTFRYDYKIMILKIRMWLKRIELSRFQKATEDLE